MNMEAGENKPEVSIIVPVYNAERFLGECVESVLDQSYADWELLLVDDGSTDGSSVVCRYYAEADGRIKTVTQENGGVSSARNVGLDMARGNYVFFLDADDELYPYTISLLHKIATSDNAEIVIGRSVNSERKPDDKNPDYENVARGVKIENSYKVCRDMLYRKPHPDTSVCGRLMSRYLFDDIRFYPGRYEDLEIFHKLLMKAKKVAVIENIVYFYRDNPSSFINKWSESRRDSVKVTREIVRHYADDPVLRKAALNRYFRANYNLLLALLRYRPDDMVAINDCYANVKALRRIVLTDPHSRIKTRIGALMSYIGLGFIRRLAKV